MFLLKTIFLFNLNQPISLNQATFPTNLTMVTNPNYQFRVLLLSLPSHHIILSTLQPINKCKIKEDLNNRDIILKIWVTRVNSKLVNFLTSLLMPLVVFMLMVFLMIVMREKWLIFFDLFQDTFKPDLLKKRLSRVESFIIVLLILKTL